MSEKKKENIQIEQGDYIILSEILSKYPYKFYVYGSRARGYAARYSDLDIFCKEKIDDESLVNIKSQLEESNITIKIDILDKSNCTQAFFKLIEKDLIELNYTPSR